MLAFAYDGLIIIIMDRYAMPMGEGEGVCVNMLEALSSVKMCVFFFFHCHVRGVCIYMKACLHACRHSSGCACVCVVVSVEALRLTQGMGLPSLFRLSR